MAEPAAQLKLSHPEPPAASPLAVPAVLAGTAPEWLAIADLPAKAGVSASYIAKWRMRRWRALRKADAGKARREFDGGRERYIVHRSVQWLPGDARTAGDLHLETHGAGSVPAPASAPPGWATADKADQERHLIAQWARRRLLELRAEHPRLSDGKIHGLHWRPECEPKLRAHGIGASLSTARRLLRWRPSEALYADGRRQRGGNVAPPGSELFRGELLHMWLKVMGGVAGTFRTAFEVAAGRALQRGESLQTEAASRKWAYAQVPESMRGFWRDEREWHRKHGEFARRDYTKFRPNQVWSGDWHRCDFRIRHRGKWVRPWLAVWEDMGSRKIVGLALAIRPDTDGLLCSFAEAVTEYGAPELIIIDNGKDYTSKALAGEGAHAGKRRLLSAEDEARIAGVCGACGVKVSFCWPFNPGAKPLESWFRTFCLKVARLMPTYTGNAPGARHANVEAAVKAGKAEELDIGQAERIVRQYIADVYHKTPHRGGAMGSLTPDEAFARDPIPKRTAPEHVLRRMLLKQVRVRVTSRGVRWNAVNYRAYDRDGRSLLLPHEGQDVMLLVPWRESADASRIEVRTLDGKLICEATAADLDGCDVGTVKKIRHRNKGMRKQAREAAAAMNVVNKPIAAQARIEAQTRYRAELNKGRRMAAGAESDRGTQLLPGAANYFDDLPDRPVGGDRDTDVASPLDHVPVPETQLRIEPASVLDEAPEVPTKAAGDTAEWSGPFIGASQATDGGDVGSTLDWLPDLPIGGAEDRR